MGRDTELALAQGLVANVVASIDHHRRHPAMMPWKKTAY